MEYASIDTPAACYADFCLIPVRTHTHALGAKHTNVTMLGLIKVGTGTISVAEEVAEVQRVLKLSGLKYTMHSAGTTVGAFGP